MQFKCSKYYSVSPSPSLQAQVLPELELWCFIGGQGQGTHAQQVFRGDCDVVSRACSERQTWNGVSHLSVHPWKPGLGEATKSVWQERRPSRDILPTSLWQEAALLLSPALKAAGRADTMPSTQREGLREASWWPLSKEREKEKRQDI